MRKSNYNNAVYAINALPKVSQSTPARRPASTPVSVPKNAARPPPTDPRVAHCCPLSQRGWQLQVVLRDSVYRPIPPCTTPFRSLQPSAVKRQNMRLGQHHSRSSIDLHDTKEAKTAVSAVVRAALLCLPRTWRRQSRHRNRGHSVHTATPTNCPLAVAAAPKAGYKPSINREATGRLKTSCRTV